MTTAPESIISIRGLVNRFGSQTVHEVASMHELTPHDLR